MMQGSKAVLSPGEIDPKEKKLRDSLVRQIKNIPGGEGINKCIQCGTCVASCPSAAATAKHFSDEMIFAEIEGILR
ncbi:4Fe-4S dicluster domain-containing protein [Acidobacteriota bacterium]